jgi:hypothetical protein
MLLKRFVFTVICLFTINSLLYSQSKANSSKIITKVVVITTNYLILDHQAKIKFDDTLFFKENLDEALLKEMLSIIPTADLEVSSNELINENLEEYARTDNVEILSSENLSIQAAQTALEKEILDASIKDASPILDRKKDAPPKSTFTIAPHSFLSLLSSTDKTDHKAFINSEVGAGLDILLELPIAAKQWFFYQISLKNLNYSLPKNNDFLQQRNVFFDMNIGAGFSYASYLDFVFLIGINQHPILYNITSSSLFLALHNLIDLGVMTKLKLITSPNFSLDINSGVKIIFAKTYQDYQILNGHTLFINSICTFHKNDAEAYQSKLGLTYSALQPDFSEQKDIQLSFSIGYLWQL